MALANFFFRTIKSIDQVLCITDPDKLSERLESISVAITFNDVTLMMPNTEIILSMTLNLIARLYPHIDILYNGSSTDGKQLVGRLIELVKAINPTIDIANKDSKYHIAICVGDSDVDATTKIFLMADSWNIEVGINGNKNQLDGNILNPLSAAAVACFGVAEVFKIVFSDLQLTTETELHYILSLFDYKKVQSTKRELPPIDLKEVHLVGLGAVGNALVWSLARIPDLSGTINLIDDEKVDLSNLQRYILTDQNSVGILKTDLAERYLEHEGLCINKYPLRLGDYVSNYNQDCLFNVIAISVDNYHDRVSAQALLPRAIINSWTGESGFLGLSRHWFDSSQACLACLYKKSQRVKSHTDKIADTIGLDAKRTAELYVKNVKLTRDLLEEIALIKEYNIDDLLPWEDHTLAELYSEAICGGLLIKLENANDANKELVPLAHQSALAGVLLATELVKESLGITKKEDPVEIRFNMLSVISEYISIPRKKALNSKCICGDNDYLTIYREKYGF